MKNLKKLDYFNLCGIILAVAGLIVEYIGGAVLSVSTTIGFNFDLSPVIVVGIGMIVLGLISSIIGTVFTVKKGLNRKLSTIALYVSAIALMLSIVYVVLVVVMPVLRPTNG